MAKAKSRSVSRKKRSVRASIAASQKARRVQKRMKEARENEK